MASTEATICRLLLESDVGLGAGDPSVAVGGGGDTESVALVLGVMLGEGVGTTGVVQALPLRLIRMASTSQGTRLAKVVMDGDDSVRADARPLRRGARLGSDRP